MAVHKHYAGSKDANNIPPQLEIGLERCLFGLALSKLNFAWRHSLIELVSDSEVSGAVDHLVIER